MAKPRIFISSTFYDLRHVRTDLERFIKDMGYDPVLNERGAIPYGKESALEDYCYKEIDSCDILISLVGGRFGTGSERAPYSISQMELKYALEAHKQVHIFVDRNVLAEYSTYQANKDNEIIKYRHVDNIKVYKFLDEINALPRNNPITHFETSQDITSFLKAQWAGIFQRLLREETRKEELQIIRELNLSVETLHGLVDYITKEKKDGDEAIKTILLSTHPAFQAIKKVVDIPHRIYFTNIDELSELLDARNFKPVDENKWDDKTQREWVKTVGNTQTLLKVATSVFDDKGKLKVVTNEDWKKDYIISNAYEIESKKDSDIPF